MGEVDGDRASIEVRAYEHDQLDVRHVVTYAELQRAFRILCQLNRLDIQRSGTHVSHSARLLVGSEFI